MPAPEGRKILMTLLIFTLVSGIIGFGFDYTYLKIFYFIFGGLFIFSINFFRDPIRIPPAGEKNIVSPADGRVVVVKDVNDEDVGKGKQISIFLNIFNVHSNKIPIAGRVEKVDYKIGNFKAAFDHSASDVNEQAVIVLSHGDKKIKIKQVAGLIARRIHCYAKVGKSYQTGDRFGFIMFGSRTDLIVPSDSNINIQVGDKVRGAKDIIGQIA